MIRDRLVGALKKVALKAFGMEHDASDRTTYQTKGSKDGYDASKIPKLVQGDGDTPGPNDKKLIGSTWLAAQLVGGVPGTIVDVRPPQEWMSGHIPGAILLPHDQILSRLDLLPAKDIRITIVDATGEQEAFDIADKLRGQGWNVARSLQGGWAWWMEHDEPSTRPETREGLNLGDSVETGKGQRGAVQGFGDGTVDLLGDDGPILAVKLADLK